MFDLSLVRILIALSNHTRELLAKTYLANTDMTTEDIAFLLGYQEIGSFLRAFTVWTGQTVSEHKVNVQRQQSV